jgi:hypothetical protein
MSRGKYRKPSVAPSRPDYRPHDGMGRLHNWTEDTPTSTKRLKAQKVEKYQVQEQARVRVRKAHPEPSADELARIQVAARKAHDAGLVRDPDQNQAYRVHLDRLSTSAPSTRSRYAPDRFGEGKATAIATRWMGRVEDVVDRI